MPTVGAVTVAVVLAIAASVLAATSPIARPAAATQPTVRLGFAGVPDLGGCPHFPGNNPWNTDISGAPVNVRSGGIIATIESGDGTHLHPDVGENPQYCIPFVVVSAIQSRMPISYDADGDESDLGPFPIPLDAPIERRAGSSGDRHVIAMQQGTCELFELDDAHRSADGWTAGAGARFGARSNGLDLSGGRVPMPPGWRSCRGWSATRRWRPV